MCSRYLRLGEKVVCVSLFSTVFTAVLTFASSDVCFNVSAIEQPLLHFRACFVWPRR